MVRSSSKVKKKKENFYYKLTFFDTLPDYLTVMPSQPSPTSALERLLNPSRKIFFFNSSLRAALGLKGRATVWTAVSLLLRDKEFVWYRAVVALFAPIVRSSGKYSRKKIYY